MEILWLLKDYANVGNACRVMLREILFGNTPSLCQKKIIIGFFKIIFGEVVFSKNEEEEKDGDG